MRKMMRRYGVERCRCEMKWGSWKSESAGTDTGTGQTAECMDTMHGTRPELQYTHLTGNISFYKHGIEAVCGGIKLAEQEQPTEWRWDRDCLGVLPTRYSVPVPGRKNEGTRRPDEIVAFSCVSYESDPIDSQVYSVSCLN